MSTCIYIYFCFSHTDIGSLLTIHKPTLLILEHVVILVELSELFVVIYFAHWLSVPFFSYSLGILSELYPALFVVYQSIIIL